jgi:hypothetical protein
MPALWHQRARWPCAAALGVTLILFRQRLAGEADVRCWRRAQSEAGSILAFFFPFDAIPGSIGANGVPREQSAAPTISWRLAAIPS